MSRGAKGWRSSASSIGTTTGSSSSPTRGDLVEADDVLYLGDIDLSSFGPYYGDAWSSLDDFERTLAMVRELRARWYATFHHIGVLEGAAFLERLARFTAVIAHRFVYRPGDDVPYADTVERRSMSQHLDRLVAAGTVAAVARGRFRRVRP